MIEIKRLVWDDWNVEHIRKHKVSVGEVEEACKRRRKTLKSYQKRLLVFGQTKEKRFLTIVLAPEGKGKYYVVTARNISRKERRFLND